MHGSLSRLHSWELNHQQDDVRGWLVRDAQGETVGTVKDLIVDTHTQHVTDVVLNTGKRWPAHDLEIGGNHTLTLLAQSGMAQGAISGAETESTEPSTRGEATLRGATMKMGMGMGMGMDKREEGPASSSDDDHMIPVIDEDFDLSKRRVDAGGARVRRFTVEEPFQADLRLREEKVIVERQKVDRLLSPEEAAARFRDESFEMTARTEFPFTTKSAHIVEEVVLAMGVNEHVEHVTEAVRHTDVQVTEIPRARQTPIQGAKP